MILFAKSHVRAHTRVTASGKVVQVGPYSTRTVAGSHVQPVKGKGARDPHTLDLFSDHATAHVEPKPVPAPAKGHAETFAKVPAESKDSPKPGGGGGGGPIRKGDVVEILPEWQDKGDDQFTWVALGDEEKGRIDIQPVDHPMAIKPTQTVRVDQVRRVEGGKKPAKDWRDEENWHTRTMERMKTLPDDALVFIRKDATEAAEAAEKMGGRKAGQYRDEAHYASMEIRRRMLEGAKKGGKPKRNA